MELTRRQVMRWADSETLGAGSKLQAAGAVQGLRAEGELLAGSVKLGAARLVVKLRVRDGRPVAVICPCGRAKGAQPCLHAVAVALQWAHDHAAPEAGDLGQPVFSAERAPTRAEIARWASHQLLARAEALRVGRVTFNHPIGLGTVRTASGGALPVSFRLLPNGLVEGQCPCAANRDRGQICEHILALALAVSQRFGSPERLAAAAAERAHAARLAGAKGMIARAKDGTPATLRILLPRDVPAQFAKGAVKVGVCVSVGRQAMAPGALPPGPWRLSEADETLLGILEDVAGGPPEATMSLRQEDFLAVIRCGERSWVGSAATHRRLEVGGAPVETPLALTADPGHDALRVEIGIPPGGAPLVAGTLGFWFDGACARPLAHLLPLPFRPLYAAPQFVPRAEILHFLEADLKVLAAAVPLDPDRTVTADLFTTAPATPRFRLLLSGTPDAASASLTAVYDGQEVVPGVRQTIALPDPDDFFRCRVRDEAAEQDALARVHGMGFHGAMGNRLSDVIGGRAVCNLLGEHLPAARRAGWEVSVTGALGAFLAGTAVAVPTVAVRETAPGGAFEMTTSYAVPGGGPRLAADDVAHALRNGDAFVRRDGRVTLLDLGAIRAVRRTLRECAARAGDAPGSSRVEAVQAPFVLEALGHLEGIDFEAAPDWRARAERQNRRRRPEPVSLGALEPVLRPYQKEGVYWLRFLEACGFCGILADDMGLGKTLQTLTWLSLPRCREEARRAPALIVCPTSLVENWRREAERFTPGLRVVVVAGPDRAPLFAQVPTCDLAITSYALIRRDIDFHASCRYSAVVLDEAQAIKNQRTQNALAVKRLVADSRLVLTGTPIENGVGDLWSIMDFLMPRYLGAYEDFQALYETPLALGGAEAIAAQERLRLKLRPFLLRRVKEEVAQDLPPKIRSVTYCALTPAQRAAYDACRATLRDEMRALIRQKGFERSKLTIFALLTRLRRICCDLRLAKDRRDLPAEEASAKTDALLDILDEARAGGHRLLVFSQFTSLLRLVAARLDAAHVPYCYLDGATKDRLGECNRFNRSDIPLFLISLKAGNTGLNLTGADTVVLYDPWWNPAAEEQAIDRAHRIGQRKTVHAIRLIAQDTIEERILDLQRKKQALIDATVNTADSALAQSLTMADIEALLA